MSYVIGYFLPMVLCLLMVGLLFMTDIKAYILHILFIICAVIPILNWLAFIAELAIILCGVCDGNLEIKRNKLTKFLFGLKDEED